MCSTDCSSGCECGEFSTVFCAAFNVITDSCNSSLLQHGVLTVDSKTSCVGGRHNMPPPPVTCDLDLLTLKVISESRVTWAISLPILVFLGLSVLDLGPMYAKDRETSADVGQTSDSLGAWHNK